MSQPIPSGGWGRQVKYAKVDSSTDGATIVAAVTGAKIRVIGYQLVCGATGVGVTFKSNTTAISALKKCAANGGVSADPNPYGYFETTSGEALKLGLDAAQTVGCDVQYVEVF